MKGHLFFTAVILACLLKASAQVSSPHTPKLIKNEKGIQLLVDGEPFLILGGELGNSSASSNDYMRPLWPRLKQMNLNTLFTPVYWELVEPKEGDFDFSLVDTLLKNARLHKIRLVLLWFGAWKNSMSCYAPEWVKTNTERFPRALDKNGVQQEIISPFNKNNLEADKKAFVSLMRHIRQVDSKTTTVIAIQVENEIGMLPNARDYNEAANEAFHQAVPDQLPEYLQKNKNNLTPELKSRWEKNGFKSSGGWADFFGESVYADEIFMAWYFAKYVNEIAAAGKNVYDLPMYVNAALNRPGWEPGTYPSGGPLPHLFDIWKAAAPAIDILAPDIYFPDFQHWCDLYATRTNPLFIPEIRFEPGDEARAFFAFGNYNCISFSPFSIESTDRPEKEPIGKTYKILSQVAHLVARYQPLGNVAGFLLSKDSSSKQVTMGNYRVTVKHDYTLGWSPEAKTDPWPLTGCTITLISSNEFYVAGTGVVLTFESTTPGQRTGFLSVDEGNFVNGKWIAGRRMNGDQDHQGRHVRIPVNEWNIQRVRLYQY